MSEPLPARFRLVVRDDAMPPMRPGHFAHFVPASAPRPNQVFLWASDDGSAVIRRCVEAMPGRWLAVADAATGYAPLDVAQLGLRVVGAYRGHTWDEPCE